MPIRIPIAHDFICPWCWVGFLQANRLRAEFDVEIEWLGYELFPDELEWPDYPAAPALPENRVPTLSRFELLLAADGMKLPSSRRPHKMRTHYAHEAVEYAKTLGFADELIEVLYKAYWLDGVNINDIDTLLELAVPVVGHREELRRAIEERRFKHHIIGFDEPAYRDGVYNVPTFFISGKKYAEQPYSVLKDAVQRESSSIYADLEFPEGPPNRPYVAIDMVSTIDGKILSGARGESVTDLGSAVDHQLMRRLESKVDGVLIGAGTLRATSNQWNPQAPFRFVVSHTGAVPFDALYFAQNAYLVVPQGHAAAVPAHVKLIECGAGAVDLEKLLSEIKALGVKSLLVLGGSELNGQLIRMRLVDELFLTIAPKVRLGDDIPTYAGGEALPRSQIELFHLIEHHTVGDEIFLRYRRALETNRGV